MRDAGVRVGITKVSHPLSCHCRRTDLHVAGENGHAKNDDADRCFIAGRDQAERRLPGAKFLTLGFQFVLGGLRLRRLFCFCGRGHVVAKDPQAVQHQRNGEKAQREFAKRAHG